MASDSHPQSPSNRWLVLSLVMIGTFMSILDTSIVNVALPHMMSELEVNRNQIEWVATGFMLATAVAMPLVGWLVGRLGHKVLYLGSLSLFTIGSALCTIAWSYDSLILARIIQAVGGGAIQPVGMAIIAELFAPEERGKALGIWGTGIMIGPSVGPTLGGYLTDTFNWRSIFSVNLPFGFLALILGLTVMENDRRRLKQEIPFDWWGFFFLSMALVAGLLALSKGHEKGWSSTYIVTCLSLAMVGSTMFLATESVIDHPLLDLKLFRYRNYSLSMGLAIFRAVGLFGGVFLLPIFLEKIVGYTTIQTGLWMMPGAVTIGIMMPVAGRMADRYNPRWLVFTGSVMTGLSLIYYGNLSPLSPAFVIIGPQVIRGLGLALMMAPLMAAAINSVPQTQVATAASFLNVSQRVGGSFGIALLNTFVTDSVRVHALRLGELVGNNPQSLRQWTELSARVSISNAHGFFMTDQLKGVALAVREIYLQANILAFENGFVLAGTILLLSLPLCLFLQDTKRVRNSEQPN
ncbi:DHA2 family efflux MFS transporter permease subunit [Thermodesulfobacteriota bacterium]